MGGKWFLCSYQFGQLVVAAGFLRWGIPHCRKTVREFRADCGDGCELGGDVVGSLRFLVSVVARFCGVWWGVLARFWGRFGKVVSFAVMLCLLW